MGEIRCKCKEALCFCALTFVSGFVLIFFCFQEEAAVQQSYQAQPYTHPPPFPPPYAEQAPQYFGPGPGPPPFPPHFPLPPYMPDFSRPPPMFNHPAPPPPNYQDEGFHARWAAELCRMVNPLRSNSDHCQISLCNISSLLYA